ncbi:MAG TPA: SAV_915 family protein [Pseudonocardiaceae bacterium]|nr:SAV_915 family protein [Pseudonocardiaceae bacterium]
MSVVDEHGSLTEDAIDAGRPWAFVPTRSILGPDEQVCPELRRTGDGQLALLAYTSLERLVDSCGPDQPWVLVPVDWFDRIHAECRFDTIALNLALPAECRQREYRDWPGKPEDWND